LGPSQNNFENDLKHAKHDEKGRFPKLTRINLGRSLKVQVIKNSDFEHVQALKLDEI
jgi:hypothetical protein